MIVRHRPRLLNSYVFQIMPSSMSSLDLVRRLRRKIIRSLERNPGKINRFRQPTRKSNRPVVTATLCPSDHETVGGQAAATTTMRNEIPHRVRRRMQELKTRKIQIIVKPRTIVERVEKVVSLKRMKVLPVNSRRNMASRRKNQRVQTRNLYQRLLSTCQISLPWVEERPTPKSPESQQTMHPKRDH